MENLNTYCVYMHVNEVNGKKYIGITCQEPKKRWANGLGYQKEPHFWSAIKKYGWDSFEHYILYDNLTVNEANLYEQWLIYIGNTNNNQYGYNVTDGGCGINGYRHTKESKKKMSEKHWNCSGENNPNYGISVTEERRQKQREKMIGRKASKETKQKMNISKFGEKNPRAKKVVQYDLNNNYIQTFDCISDACRKLNIINNGHISQCCKGKRNTAYGFIWKYIEKEAAA